MGLAGGLNIALRRVRVWASVSWFALRALANWNVAAQRRLGNQTVRRCILRSWLALQKNPDLECSRRAIADHALAQGGQAEAGRSREAKPGLYLRAPVLSLVDRNDPLTELIAKKIIEIGASGVRDPIKISELVVRKFGNPSSGAPNG
jgi:hypothetical protein